MNTFVNQIIEDVAAWEGVSVNPHRFGGREFNLGKVEIGHIHSNGMVDIPFTRLIREQLIMESRAEHHHLLRDSGWISFYIRRAEDVVAALWLYKLSYIQKSRSRSRGSEDALSRLAKELDGLRPSDEIRALVKL